MTPPRLRHRAALALAALPLLLVAGCGSDDGGGDAPDPDELADQLARGEIPPLQGEECDVEGSIAGAVEQDLSGTGAVSVSESDLAPPATYQFQVDQTTITLFSDGNGFDAGALVQVGSDPYGVETGDSGLGEIAGDGSGATATATAEAVGAPGESIELDVTFSC